jgi:hypothetical protein
MSFLGLMGEMLTNWEPTAASKKPTATSDNWDVVQYYELRTACDKTAEIVKDSMTNDFPDPDRLFWKGRLRPRNPNKEELDRSSREMDKEIKFTDIKN